MSRLQSKASLNPSRSSLDSSVPGDLALEILVSHALLVILIPPAKVWLLERGVGSLWLAINVIAGGGMAVLIWIALRGGLKVKGTVTWSTFWAGAGLTVLQQSALFYALRRLPSTRILMIAPFAHHFLRVRASSVRVRSVILAFAALSGAALYDARFSIPDLRHTIPAYVALLLHAVTTNALNRVTQILTLNFLSPDVSRALLVLAASILTVPLHVFGRAVSFFPSYPYVPLLALLPLPFLSFLLLFLFPRTLSSSLQYHSSFTLSYIPTVIVSFFLTPLFTRQWLWSDLCLIPPFYYAFKPDASSLPRSPDPKLLLQPYLRTILASPESRKIFYFLLLNLLFMLVQMLYGVWTNSLGLISDAIHMAFDCMAIAMGLFASVMSGWERNERFTYGYGRVETLSGFANGIFLILISVFIVFEAVQRLLDPPEMNTNQLLLVSSVGLGVNLFGMFAMGGHHHHGHSHSHEPSHSKNGGHGHSHSRHNDHHSHPPLSSRDYSGLEHDPSKYEHDHNHGHEHESSHQNDHDGHGHGPEHDRDKHGRSHGHGHSHDGHDDSHGHNHSHSPAKLRKVPEPLNLKPQHYLDAPDVPSFRFLSHNSEPTDNFANLSSLAPSGHFSPLTPSYSFTHDAHIAQHHPEIHNHRGEGHSHNMRGVFLHVLADTLGSVGVIFSTLLIRYFGWTGFDPIASLFIAVLIAASVWPLVQETGRLLGLDLGDEGEGQVRSALKEVGNVQGVAGYSAPRFWMRDTGVIVGSLRVHLEPWFVQALVTGSRKGRPCSLDGVQESVEHVLKAKIHGLEEVVIQLDG